ncbi:MAG: hypothetical protein ACD_63C00210G0005 [uncultured bacterium]|nr:MAG: hypothetical protein ACD_63C00210G0005 [uncultured bacterium]
MAVEVKRKDKESIEGMLRRFNKKLLQSGNLYRARKVRFYERKKSKKIRQEEAMRKGRITRRREYLKRMGLIGMRKFRKSQQRIFQMRRAKALAEKNEKRKKTQEAGTSGKVKASKSPKGEK